MAKVELNGGKRCSTRRSAALGLALAIALGWTPPGRVSAATPSAPVDLGTLSDPGQTYPFPPQSQANAIANSGTVVGQADNENTAGDILSAAATWNAGSGAGTATALSGVQSQANAVNNLGQIAGVGSIPDANVTSGANNSHAILWTPIAGGYQQTDLNTNGVSAGQAYAINDSGQIAGVEVLRPPSAPLLSAASLSHATVWNKSTTGKYLSTDLASALDENSGAAAINAGGQVAGFSSDGFNTHATVWLPPSGAARSYRETVVSQLVSQANALNDSGQVAGLATFGNQIHAATWLPPASPGGAYPSTVDLGTLGGGTGSQALGINRYGQIVGAAFVPGSSFHAVLWTPRAYGSSSYVATDLGLLGGDQSYATGINDAGQIAGWSTIPGSTPDSRILHAVLWSPRLVVSGFTSLISPGVPQSFTVTALDAAGNPMPQYAGTIRFSSSDAAAQLPGPVQLRGGVGIFSAILRTPGPQSLVATDTVLSAITGAQTGITVLDQKQLSIVKTGTGSGTVSSAPAGIACGLTCSGSFPRGTAVTLSAATAGGSSFAGWSGGGCSGTGTCTVTLSADASVTASFSGSSHAVGVLLAGQGGGVVASSPSGISCPSSCSQLFPSGSGVTLTAAAAAGSTFAGWSGAGCTGATPSCTLVADVDRNVTARFTAPAMTLGTRAIDFGSLPVGSPSRALLTVLDSGDGSLTLDATAGPSPPFAQTNDCGGGLSPGSACTITAAFAPLGGGSYAGTLSVRNRSTGDTQAVTLNGGGEVVLSGDASVIRVEELTLLKQTSSPLTLQGGQGICEAGPVNSTVTSTTTGSGATCLSSQLLSNQTFGLASAGNDYQVQTQTPACPGACASSVAASLRLLPGAVPGGVDVLSARGLQARSTTSCGSPATASSSVASLSIAGQSVSTRPTGSQIVLNPLGGRPGSPGYTRVYGTPIVVNPTGARIPMAIVTLNYSRHTVGATPRSSAEVSSPVEVEFPPGGPLASLIIGRVFLTYAQTGSLGC